MAAEPTLIAVICTLINLICATVYVYAPRRHAHEYDDWSGWIQDDLDIYYGKVRAVRYRTCKKCQRVESQEAGEHRCVLLSHYMKKPLIECPHLADLIGNEMGKIKRLEKELGLDGHV